MFVFAGIIRYKTDAKIEQFRIIMESDSNKIIRNHGGLRWIRSSGMNGWEPSTRILTDAPNRIHTLGEFCEMFGAAKSTISEDIDLVSESFERFDLGKIETVAGAAGGVRYRAIPSPERARRVLTELAERLAQPGTHAARRIPLHVGRDGGVGHGAGHGRDSGRAVLRSPAPLCADHGDQGHSHCADDGARCWTCRWSLPAATAAPTRARR